MIGRGLFLCYDWGEGKRMKEAKTKLSDRSLRFVADELGITPETARYHIRENNLPAVKDGRVWRIPYRLFARWKRTRWVYLSRKKG